MAFNRVVFLAAFAGGLDSLRAAEGTTKRELRALSRSLLEGLHFGDDGTEPGAGPAIRGDIQYINAVLGVLTPINRKVAVLYFKAHTGFHFSKDANIFEKKDKKRYDECREKAAELLANPNENIWTWAERNVEVEEKEYDLKVVTKAIERAIKKTNNDHVGVLRAVLQGGLAPDAIIALMQEMSMMPSAPKAAPKDMGMADEVKEDTGTLPPF